MLLVRTESTLVPLVSEERGRIEPEQIELDLQVAMVVWFGAQDAWLAAQDAGLALLLIATAQSLIVQPCSCFLTFRSLRVQYKSVDWSRVSMSQGKCKHEVKFLHFILISRF